MLWCALRTLQMHRKMAPQKYTQYGATLIAKSERRLFRMQKTDYLIELIIIMASN